jgi:hypothetical protein
MNHCLTGLADMTFHTFGTTLWLCLRDRALGNGFLFQLCDELSALATPTNILKNLRLEMNANIALGVSSRGEWGRLDAVLSSPRWFCLEQVSLDFITGDKLIRKELKLIREELELLSDLSNTQLSCLSSHNFKFFVRLQSISHL